MNRPYVYNRDKGKCKICNGYIEPSETEIHHANTKLPLTEVNKVRNLITVHHYCHTLIHSENEPNNLSEAAIKRLRKYRKILNESNN